MSLLALLLLAAPAAAEPALPAVAPAKLVQGGSAPDQRPSLEGPRWTADFHAAGQPRGRMLVLPLTGQAELQVGSRRSGSKGARNGGGAPLRAGKAYSVGIALRW